MVAKLTSESYLALAKERGLTWLGIFPVNTKTKTQWCCGYGHEWETTYQSLSNQKFGCPICAGTSPKTRDDYYAIAQKRCLVWFEEMPINTHAKTRWQCAKGHVFMSTYNHIRKGHGCQICGNIIPKTADDYHALAVKRGFTWIGNLPRNVGANTEWICPNGHKFVSRYSDIAHKGGCAKCAGLAKLTSADFHNVAGLHGYIWLGSTPVGTHKNTDWQCPNGHIWHTSYTTMKARFNCPHCQDRHNGNFASKPQRAIHALIGGVLNYRNKRVNRYCIDIALDTDTLFPIAIEYDAYFWHSKQLEQDAKRDKWLLSHGWSILRIKSAHLIPAPAEIHAAIARLRRGETTYIEIVMSDYKP